MKGERQSGHVRSGRAELCLVRSHQSISGRRFRSGAGGRFRFRTPPRPALAPAAVCRLLLRTG